MAKPRQITGLDPDKRLRPNARRILATRIAEVWDFGPFVVSPERVRELHDMRIAFKRLRYLLEIFSIAFTDDLTPDIARIKAVQVLLGDIHDRDVQIPQLQDQLERLDEIAAAIQHEARREDVPAGRPVPPRDLSHDRYRARLDTVPIPSVRPGLEALLARRIAERDALYARFRETWDALQADDFRRTLERSIGV